MTRSTTELADRAAIEQWDFFLAHAGADTGLALALYDLLARNARVFLDERSMRPGDVWTRVLPAVLRQSRITVVLVSAHTRTAWYQESEIRIALDLVRDDPDRYRVVALLLDEKAPIRRSDLPYGLEQTVTLSWAACGSLEKVVEHLLDTLHSDETARSGGEVARLDLTDAVTAFVGEAESGPASPVLLTSWDDFTRHYGQTADLERTYLPVAVRGFFENGGERAYVVRVIARDAARALVRIPTADPNQHLLFTARSTGAHGNEIVVNGRPGSRIGVRLTIGTVAETGAEAPSAVRTEVRRTDVEDFDNLSPGLAGPNPLLEIVNARSALVSVESDQPSRGEAMPEIGEWRLAGGADGLSTVQDYIGSPEVSPEHRTGLAAVAALDDVAIVCVPDATHPRFSVSEQEELTASIIAHCERYVSLGILGTRPDQDCDTAPLAPADTSSAAIYFPWIRIRDPHGGDPVLVPPVGHIAGAFARHDREVGVHAPPTGLELNGLAADATGRQLACTLDASRTDDFVRRGVNVLVAAATPEERVVLGSAVTMALDTTWQPIRVRRFLNFVTRAITAGTAWVVGAPSNEPTWNRVTEEIAGFLRRLWRAGVLLGSSPEEAFFVRCDRSTMTEDDIANGRVVWTIGVALADKALKFPTVGTATGPRIEGVAGH